MATYTQWLKKSSTPAKVTWVAGDQAELRESVVELLRATYGEDYSSYVASSASKAEIWDDVFQEPSGQSKLICVREPEAISDWSRLLDWIAVRKQIPWSNLVFVSAKSDFPYSFKDNKKVALLPHVKAIQGAGHIVRCSLPNEKDMITWAQQYVPSGLILDKAVTTLLSRSGGDLHIARSVLEKITALGVAPTEQAIELLTQAEPDFEVALLSLDKDSARRAAGGITEPRGTLLRLETKLSVAEQCYRASQARKTLRDVVSTGTSFYLASAVWPVAKHYDPKRVSSIRTILAELDGYSSSSVAEHLLPTLVELW